MPVLKLRSLRLRARTSVGLFGADIPLSDGLTVLRAENTSGKSTCVQSIVYALGLEGMLGPSYAVPMPHVMTHSLHDSGVERAVIESWVTLDIENGNGERLRVIRAAKSSRQDLRLIKTSILDQAGVEVNQRDYFVRIRGAATNEDGFHERLARFVGWKLPEVARYDGTTCPLYMEALFPLFFVEQKHGWSGIQARTPMHFRIREVGKRAVEFALDLNAYDNSVRRTEVEQELRLVQSDWAHTQFAFKQKAQRLGALLTKVPESPVSEWAKDGFQPELLIARGSNWISIGAEISDLAVRLHNLDSVPAPRAELTATAVEAGLRSNEELFSEIEFGLLSLNQGIHADQAQIRSVDQRLAALRDDLTKNRDVILLQKLGGFADLELSKGFCPTCHQRVSGILQPMEAGQFPMALEDNIQYIESQISLFSTMREAVSSALEAKAARGQALREKMTELREAIRAQKATLTAASGTPSEASIEEKLRTRARIQNLRRLEEESLEVLDRLFTLSSKWKTLQGELGLLRKGDLSNADEQKLKALESSFISQISAYGLSSVSPSSLTISRETYRPSHDGFDLGFDLSASDMIRTIWAYLLGLLEVARQERSNHPGLLILDEPRQQETARWSYAQLLRRASSAGQYGQQVIFATSEELDNLRDMLAGTSHNLFVFEGEKIFRRIES